MNEKMLKLMTLMAEHGYITMQEAQSIYECERSTQHNIKLLLNDYSFATDFETAMDPKRAYYLTVAGYEHLEMFGRMRVNMHFSKHNYDKKYFYHTLIGLKIRLLFEKHPAVVDYRPEKVLAYYGALKGEDITQQKYKHCDAEMLLKTAGGEYKVGVEIELTSKKYYRLLSAVKSIDAHRSDLDKVLWICSYELIMKDLQTAVSKCRRELKYPDRHLFILMRDLEATGLAATWCDFEGNKIKLFDDKKQSEQSGQRELL
ncbi:MAG TPA: hypothetical protein DCX95_03020 [Elusimicrobia bacterium]|nr:hypothetical protein [Elusimicrobiota bacterium]